MYVQDIRGVVYKLGIPEYDPIVSLLDRAIDMHDRMTADNVFLRELDIDALNTIARNYRIDGDVLNGISGFQTLHDFVVKKYGPRGSMWSICVDMVNPAYLYMCRVFAQAIIQWSELHSSIDDDEVDIVAAIRTFYALLDRCVEVCARTNNEKFVSDQFRVLHSRYLHAILHWYLPVASICRQRLEERRLTDLAAALANFTRVVFYYARYTEQKYGEIRTDTLTEIDRQGVELQAESNRANHIAENMQSSQKVLAGGSDKFVMPFTCIDAKSLKFTDKNLKDLYRLSSWLHESLLAMATEA